MAYPTDREARALLHSMTHNVCKLYADFLAAEAPRDEGYYEASLRRETAELARKIADKSLIMSGTLHPEKLSD